MNLFDLSDKTVLVTGGYGHLGAAMTRGLAGFGAQVFVLGRSQEKFRQRFPNENGQVRFVCCDISDSQSVRQAYTEVYQAQDAFDVLINNAVYFRGNDPMRISDEDWALSIDGGLNSAYRCLREAGPFFGQQQSGSIVNIGSMYGMVSPDFSVYKNAPELLNPPHYGAAKAALIQLTKYFAHYLGPDNVRVNAVSPGPFPNPKVQENTRFISELEKRTALGRIGEPRELIGAVVYLASEASSYVTGHNLVVDGGWTTV